ncbi:hypothetical protein A5821_001466 [Enterococcus sp. 7F3_DIV0205]|uniref:Uncharacterized protein n=1 Tax=Candidatus Enterococcus palustris TaxID=1834189 RepID=A0AAQ3Y7A1_9ENTE|nr:hypothetical protein A5821_001810 [Enterococcus sp. 7F3_DIV0205]
MTEVDFSSTILERIEKLQQQGWDKAALTVYINNIKEISDQSPFFVGSKIYTEMFNNSQLSDKEKVLLVIDHLGGYLDERGDLRLATTEYRFCPQMPPGDLFFYSYAKAVQRAYPTGLIIAQADKKLTKVALKKKYADETRIHQFRNQLDRCNINYVENYKKKYGLENDEAAIKMILGNDWFYADPQYHNRAHLDTDISTEDLKKGTRTLKNKGLVKKIRKRGFYRKILSADYHSEFILDEHGQLLSQWSERVKTGGLLDSAIVNGESFNYGEQPKFDPEHTHDTLDGNPPRYFDTNKRNHLKQKWLSPTDNLFYQLVRRLGEKGIRYKRKRSNSKLNKQ